METVVLETPIAARQVSTLRGAARRAYDAFIGALHAEGCGALAYRLSGPDPLPRLCVKHLRGSDRVVVTFDRDGRAWVLLVGRHLADPAQNVYDALYDMVGVRPDSGAGRSKPPCCDDHGAPPTDPDRANELVDRVQTLTRSRRRP